LELLEKSEMIMEKKRENIEMLEKCGDVTVKQNAERVMNMMN
jgi:hypothetical protein